MYQDDVSCKQQKTKVIPAAPKVIFIPRQSRNLKKNAVLVQVFSFIVPAEPVFKVVARENKNITTNPCSLYSQTIIKLS